MKRIVILIDGTWGVEGTGVDTNVAKLHPANFKAGAPLIKSQAVDGTVQVVKYHVGVGADPDFLKHWLGGSIGIGLKQIVLDCYKTVCGLYEHGDDVIICGFSRGAYAARALAGLIGASGYQRAPDAARAEIAWSNYRVEPAVRAAPVMAGAADAKAIAANTSLKAAGELHTDNAIKAVAVWDTVGSYGIPAGFGLTAIARYISLEALGFHDTEFGSHVAIGLHAVAIDEHRRPFVPTLWTAPKGQLPRATVEQTWFAGAHGNVGGGEADSGLSDEALLWMVARLQALAGLEFEIPAVRNAISKASLDGAVADSTVGWIIDAAVPHYRTILSPDAVHHGAMVNKLDPDEENINERVHWTALKKVGRLGTIGAVKNTPYAPKNLPVVPPDKIAAITAEERALLPAGFAMPE